MWVACYRFCYSCFTPEFRMRKQHAYLAVAEVWKTASVREITKAAWVEHFSFGYITEVDKLKRVSWMAEVSLGCKEEWDGAVCYLETGAAFWSGFCRLMLHDFHLITILPLQLSESLLLFVHSRFAVFFDVKIRTRVVTVYWCNYCNLENLGKWFRCRSFFFSFFFSFPSVFTVGASSKC